MHRRGRARGRRVAEIDYVTRVVTDLAEVAPAAWDGLVALDADPSPFVRHAWLHALQSSGSAVADTGWTAAHLTLWDGDTLCAACPLYEKAHSYGEYVFDWAWANAYAQHGLDYYPKGLIAVPFTPVPGSRLLARDAGARRALAARLPGWARARGLSSVHALFARDDDADALEAAGFMRRHTVQFHWTNASAQGTPWPSFDAFLADLQQDKRKKIRQERRKVAEAGVSFRWVRGASITPQDLAFFYRCYERTYLEHGNAPYLTPAFFEGVHRLQPESLLLFIAERDGRPVACSLIGLDAARGVAYGRYWGALERVDCLHFEACYYQPLAWCIAHGFRRFEGGAQGEHKMARALLPVKTTSLHWLAHPSFADAVDRFLAREGAGVEAYLEHLDHRNPLRREATPSR